MNDTLLTQAFDGAGQLLPPPYQHLQCGARPPRMVPRRAHARPPARSTPLPPLLTIFHAHGCAGKSFGGCARYASGRGHKHEGTASRKRRGSRINPPADRAVFLTKTTIHQEQEQREQPQDQPEQPQEQPQHTTTADSIGSCWLASFPVRGRYADANRPANPTDRPPPGRGALPGDLRQQCLPQGRRAR